MNVVVSNGILSENEKKAYWEYASAHTDGRELVDI